MEAFHKPLPSLGMSAIANQVSRMVNEWPTLHHFVNTNRPKQPFHQLQQGNAKRQKVGGGGGGGKPSKSQQQKKRKGKGSNGTGGGSASLPPALLSLSTPAVAATTEGAGGEESGGVGAAAATDDPFSALEAAMGQHEASVQAQAEALVAEDRVPNLARGQRSGGKRGNKQDARAKIKNAIHRERLAREARRVRLATIICALLPHSFVSFPTFLSDLIVFPSCCVAVGPVSPARLGLGGYPCIDVNVYCYNQAEARRGR